MTIDCEKLVLDNINIARNIAWKYSKKFVGLVSYEDLQSVAYEGLVVASNKFNPNLGFTFSTFAYKVICNSIRMYIRGNGKYFTDISLFSEIQENLEVQDTISDNLDIEIAMCDKLIKEQLYNEIDRLPIRYRKILLYKLNGWTEVQIAKKFNTVQSSINKDYQKSLNILRDRLKGGDD